MLKYAATKVIDTQTKDETLNQFKAAEAGREETLKQILSAEALAARTEAEKNKAAMITRMDGDIGKLLKTDLRALVAYLLAPVLVRGWRRVRARGATAEG